MKNNDALLFYSDVRKFKETKKQFDKVREDMEIALVKNAQASRHKPHEVEEATGTLTITRKCFRHLALDYVLQVRSDPTSNGSVDLPCLGAVYLSISGAGANNQYSHALFVSCWGLKSQAVPLTYIFRWVVHRLGDSQGTF